MGGRSPGSVYWSVQCTKEERDAVNAAAKAAGMNRNAFIRAWIASLPVAK